MTVMTRLDYRNCCAETAMAALIRKVPVGATNGDEFYKAVAAGAFEYAEAMMTEMDARDEAKKTKRTKR